MVIKHKKSTMSHPEPPPEAIAEIRQLNGLFLDFLKSLPPADTRRFGLSASAAAALKRAGPEEIHRAGQFPRALFRLRLEKALPDAVSEYSDAAQGSREGALKLTLLHCARNLCRISGYWARLLLRLTEQEVNWLRTAGVDQVVNVSFAADVVHAESDASDWIWRELLTESRPEVRRRLLLIGFQPDLSLSQAPGMA